MANKGENSNVESGKASADNAFESIVSGLIQENEGEQPPVDAKPTDSPPEKPTEEQGDTQSGGDGDDLVTSLRGQLAELVNENRKLKSATKAGQNFDIGKLKEDAQKDPFPVLDKLGLSVDQLVNLQLNRFSEEFEKSAAQNSGAVSADSKQLLNRLEQLEQRIKQRDEEAERMQQQGAREKFRNHIKKELDSSEKFKYAKAMLQFGALDVAENFISNVYNKTGEAPPLEDVFENVDKYFKQLYEAMPREEQKKDPPKTLPASGGGGRSTALDESPDALFERMVQGLIEEERKSR